MVDQIITIVAVVLSIIGGYLILFLWGNSELGTTFEKVSKLGVKAKINVSTFTPPPKGYRFLKRLFDFSFSLVAMILLIPIFAVIIILVKINNDGPVMYKQKRIGLNGKFFWSYKFRTMVVHEKETSTEIPRKDDIRITKVGKFLRLTALDELPAFINVLKGEMSLVGRSRALDYDAIENYLSREEKEVLLNIKPGLVSLWGVSMDRVKFKFNDIYKYDIYYTSRMSFLFDLKILVGAFFVMFGSTSQQ